ncbi:MAG TPA: hypothetical protein VFT22_06525 [Kofleriaceae bacterium]|nr:hypothetical protein [Kofleriaceae bacterium]
MFGTRRAAIGDTERAFSALVLGDALPVSAHRWATRPSVAVERSLRSAKDKHLVLQRIPESIDAKPLGFAACGRVQDSSLVRYFEAAVGATTHIGAGRSRGLARVDLKIEWENPAPARAGALLLDGDGDVQLRVTLESPALIGASIVDGNYRQTRFEIPGSTARGAVGFALRELVANIDRDPAIQDLLHEQHGARFGFLYPANSSISASPGGVSGPLPITSAWCKQATWKHGVIDTLLDRLVLLHATSAVEASRAVENRAARCVHPGCNEPLRTAHGSRQSADPPRTRTIVRVAMDRSRQSARDGQLFSQVLLAPGTVLTGTIRGIPPNSRHRLAQALGSGILSFGRGRSAGWGQANIEIEKAPVLPPLAERAAAFDGALRGRLQAAGLDTDRIGRLVPVTLLSPLWPRGTARGSSEHDDDHDDGASDLCAALGPATCFLSARRFARDGAWDQRTGEMRTFRSTAAGAVFVLELARATWRDVVTRLEALERDGIGQRRDQGFGQVVCFDPHFIASQNG